MDKFYSIGANLNVFQKRALRFENLVGPHHVVHAAGKVFLFMELRVVSHASNPL
jgi:hypothetical protein